MSDTINETLEAAEREIEAMRALEGKIAGFISNLRARNRYDVLELIDFELEAIAEQKAGPIFAHMKNADLLGKARDEIASLRAALGEKE